MKWRPLRCRWLSYQPGYKDIDSLPGFFGTPKAAWHYGAGTEPISTSTPATIRVRAMGLAGKVGLCLVSEDFTTLVSEQHIFLEESGDVAAEFSFLPEHSPCRIVVRNFDDEGRAGEVLIGAAIIY